MKLEPGNFCPLLKKDCIGLKCAWITQVRGMNPNTGEEVDEWKCAVSWMPMLAIEIAQKSHQTGSAVESFRNEVVKANNQNQQLYITALNQGVIPTQIMQVDPFVNILEESKEEDDNQ